MLFTAIIPLLLPIFFFLKHILFSKDLVTVLANYGSVKRKLWPESKDFKLGSTVVAKSLLEDFDDHNFNSPPFPRENLLSVLKLFQINIETHPNFSDKHKVGLFHTMLNLLMANNVINDSSLVMVIRKILQGILMSFTEEEWRDMDYRKACSICFYGFFI